MKKLLIVLLCITLLCSCATSKKQPDTENKNFGGTISVFAYSIDNLNPLLTRFKTNAQALSLMYNSLFITEQNLTFTPDAAKSYRFKEKGYTLNVFLKNNITFSDGSKLTAHNVINSLDMLGSNPESMYYRVFDYVKSYTALSDYEIEFKLNKRGAGVLNHLTFPILKDSDTLIGSGPYIMTSHIENKVVLNARSKTSTNIKTINIMTFPSTESMSNAFMTNEVTVLSSDFYQLAQTSTKSKVNKYEYISDYFTFMGFNKKNPFLKNVYVRYAIASCINKDDMINNLLIGYATPTNSPFKPNTIYHNLNKGDFEYNAEKAEAYIKKANVKTDEIELTLIVNSESLAKVRTAEYIATRLRSLGIKTIVSQLEYDRYIECLDNGNYDLFIGEYEMSQDYDLSFMLDEENNYFNHYNQRLTQSINNFNNAYTTDMRKCYANEIQTHLKSQLPFISLYYRNNVLTTDENIVGDIKPIQSNIFNNIKRWIAE